MFHIFATFGFQTLLSALLLNVSNVTLIQAIPSRQDFRGANGGEFRKSFHGYPPGFAQVVASPTQFQITPMQMLGRSGNQKLLRDLNQNV